MNELATWCLFSDEYKVLILVMIIDNELQCGEMCSPNLLVVRGNNFRTHRHATRIQNLQVPVSIVIHHSYASRWFLRAKTCVRSSLGELRPPLIEYMLSSHNQIGFHVLFSDRFSYLFSRSPVIFKWFAYSVFCFCHSRIGQH